MLTEDPDEASSDRTRGPSLRSARDTRHPEPYPAVRVSKHTHSAILYALEEALRHPNPFTPDIAEETASMADLAGGGGVPPTSSNGGGALPAPRRPTGAPAPTGSPSGIRGPRMIMQERAAREARQRAEAERQQLERARAEKEARLQEEAQRSASERRAAGVATGHAAAAATTSEPFIDTRRQSASGQPAMAPAPSTQQSHHRTNSARFASNQQLPSQVYSGQQQQQQQQAPPQAQFTTVPQPQPPQSQQPSAIPPQTGEPSTQPPAGASGASSKPRNSFPHAFERWETLSAHWEGLTSYWIRKLEQNKDDLSRDPVSQQLARQVTDLSAAGANLFHAVVELQRLRASSERKFQRWFFETRGELERAQEVNTMLENALDQERRNRDEAIREAVEKDQGSSQAQKQLAEMRKELAISKDEARRAWEELGRREQAERDRTLSLQAGNPTIVGGVQVVPMTQSAQRQQSSARSTATYQGGYGQGYPAESTQPPTAEASPSRGASSGGYYRQQPEAAEAPVGGYDEGEYVTDVQGNLVLDPPRARIPAAAPSSSCSGSDAEVDEYDTPTTTNPPSGSYDAPRTSVPTEGQWTGAYSDPQDYSGQGYGEPTWEETPRHHHPTRLSDVIEEEDERSRTSASQLSRA